MSRSLALMAGLASLPIIATAATAGFQYVKRLRRLGVRDFRETPNDAATDDLNALIVHNTILNPPPPDTFLEELSWKVKEWFYGGNMKVVSRIRAEDAALNPLVPIVHSNATQGRVAQIWLIDTVFSSGRRVQYYYEESYFQALCSRYSVGARPDFETVLLFLNRVSEVEISQSLHSECIIGSYVLYCHWRTTVAMPLN